MAALLETAAGADVVPDPEGCALALLAALDALELTPPAVVIAIVLFAAPLAPDAVLDKLVDVVDVTVMVGAVAVAVVVTMVKPALYWEHKARPMDRTAKTDEAGHEARMQVATMAPMEACVGPH